VFEAGLLVTAVLDSTDELAIERIAIAVKRSRGDRLFRLAARSAGGLTLALMALVFFFLLTRSSQILKVESLGKFLTTQAWYPEQANAGVGSVLFGTVLISVIAVALAFPLSIATALFISEYAPRRLQRPLTLLVDLLAAVPSIIFGVWGVFFLTPRERNLSIWLSHHMAWIPIFKVTDGQYANSPFIAGTVVALMITPIMAAVMREVFSQAPPGEREGALALGGTRWGMIRSVVLPFGRGGIIGGTMLGLGRALGETIAVALLISPIFTRSTQVLHQGANTIAALIALRFGEAGSIGISALMAAGLVLFVVTLLVNVVASIITGRSRSGALTEI
jgi:phosphate transport system permease protein